MRIRLQPFLYVFSTGWEEGKHFFPVSIDRAYCYSSIIILPFCINTSRTVVFLIQTDHFVNASFRYFGEFYSTLFCSHVNE